MNYTKNQNKIINLLAKFRGISAQSISEKLPEIDQSTVYRNLNKLVKKGVVRELVLGRVESKFELSDDHQHAVCLDCGRVRHIPLDMDKIENLIPADIDFEIDKIELVLKGKCKD